MSRLNSLDKQIKNTITSILEKGDYKDSRTGTPTYSLPGCFIRHDMSEGFPLTTLRKAPFKSAAVELEGFLKGITSKKWYQERKCGYWDHWCNPQKVPYGNDPDTIAKMQDEDDLGLIYGAQMRNFHDPKASEAYGFARGRGWISHEENSVDQLKNIIDTLKNNPNDRRMVCMYWNPLALDYQALPACHLGWVINVTGGKINLSYTMRSCDFMLGNNLNSYGLLLHLLALESGYKPGILSATFHDNHIYENQIDQAKEMASREPKALPTVITEEFDSIFEWEASDTILVDYDPHPPIKAPVAI